MEEELFSSSPDHPSWPTSAARSGFRLPLFGNALILLDRVRKGKFTYSDYSTSAIMAEDSAHFTGVNQ